MNKSHFIIIGLMALLIPTIAYGVCEYKDIETVYEYTPSLCLMNSNIVKGEALVLSDFKSINNKSSFVVYNPNDFELLAYFSYDLKGYRTDSDEYGLKLSPKGYGKAETPCFKEGSFGNCSIIKNSIKYHITKPDIYVLCNVSLPKQKEVINKPCSTDAECTGFCNIDGFCGPEKIVPCCAPERNCKDKYCLTVQSKNAGEAYECDWECKTGIAGEDGICKLEDDKNCTSNVECLSGMCNILDRCGFNFTCPNGTNLCQNVGCITPSTKDVGQDYKCVWECKSGRGNDGVCQYSNKDIIIFFVIIIFILMLGISSYFVYLRILKIKDKEKIAKEKVKEAIKREKNAEKKEKAANNKLEDANLKEKEANINITNAENRLIKIEEKIKLKEEELKELHGKAKEDLQKHIDQLKKQSHDYKQAKKEAIQDAEEAEQAKKQAKEAIKQAKEDKEKAKKEGLEAYKQQQLEKYGKQYGGRSSEVYYQDGDLRVSFKDGNTYLLSRHVYYKYIRKPNSSEEVHHIDNNNLNNEIWNLIALPKEKHNKFYRKFSHKKLEKGDWKLGISELKEQLDMTNDDLDRENKYILEHMKEVEE